MDGVSAMILSYLPSIVLLIVGFVSAIMFRFLYRDVEAR
jgi:Flp pilus assembly protein TadB